MPSAISFTLDINLQSSNAHQIRPILPNIFAENDIRRTITINKISSSISKKSITHKRLEAKQCFLPLTPTVVNVPSPVNIDIQAKLESVILKTVDCEIIDLFNQIVKRIRKLLISLDFVLFCRNLNQPLLLSMRISPLSYRNFYLVNTNISLVASSLPIKSTLYPMIRIIPCHR